MLDLNVSTMSEFTSEFDKMTSDKKWVFFWMHLAHLIQCNPGSVAGEKMLIQATMHYTIGDDPPASIAWIVLQGVNALPESRQCTPPKRDFTSMPEIYAMFARGPVALKH